MCLLRSILQLAEKGMNSMSVDALMELMTPDRLVALLIIFACVSVVITVAKSILRVVLTVIAMMAVIYFLDPSLYSFLIDLARSCIPYVTRIPHLLDSITP